LFLAKFNINNASFTDNQTAEFQLNLPAQTLVTSQNTSVLGLLIVSDVIHKDLKLKCFAVTLQKLLKFGDSTANKWCIVDVKFFPELADVVCWSYANLQ